MEMKKTTKAQDLGTEMQKRVFRNWLCSLRNLTDKQRILVAQTFQCMSELFEQEKELEGLLGKKAAYIRENLGRIRTDRFLLEKSCYALEHLAERGIFFCHRDEEGFPEGLRNIPDPPLGLYYKGKLPRGKNAVAVVGARDCSNYGEHVAALLGKALGERGIPVISGMARGVDGIAQTAAIKAGGTSFGVLGCGVDICYPPSNKGLYEALQGAGGILSTYGPGTEAVAMNFPPRNRIVSGLAQAVVVVEAGMRSGTLITVDMALEQGKDVYVIPGRITDRLSGGCNRLISQGAQILWDVEEFANNLFPKEMGNKKEAQGVGKKTPEPLALLYEALDVTPKSVDEIETALRGKYDTGELMVCLMQLVLEGLAKQPTAGYFCRV